MQLDEIMNFAADQERGREFELADPVDGTPTGIKMTIVGPDSETAHKARLALSDELSEMADADGRITAENREKARLNCLARHVIRWQITEGDEAVPFNTANLLRLLKVQWVQAQVDAFAADRRNFR